MVSFLKGFLSPKACATFNLQTTLMEDSTTKEICFSIISLMDYATFASSNLNQLLLMKSNRDILLKTSASWIMP